MKLFLVRIVYWLRGLFQNPVEFFDALGVERSDRILEIGCALGYHTLALAQIASEGKIYAVDIWQEGLQYLQRRIGPDPRIEVICRSAEAVELPRSSLDKVVCLDTLHEIPVPERAVVRWTELLKEGGKLLFRDPEVSPDRVAALSDGILHHTGTVKGTHVLVHRGWK